MERGLEPRLRQCVELTDVAFVLDVTHLRGCTRGEPRFSPGSFRPPCGGAWRWPW
jgi:hypothetical protein